MNIILGTPWWVFLIFIYLLYVGIVATRPRIIWIPKLFIIPAVLLSFKIHALCSAKSYVLVIYMLCALLGYFLGHWHVACEKFEVTISSMSVKLQGSWSTIITLMSFFAVKYLIGFMSFKVPELASMYKIVELGISGIFTWYFLGKAIGYLLRYRKI